MSIFFKKQTQWHSGIQFQRFLQCCQCLNVLEILLRILVYQYSRLSQLQKEKKTGCPFQELKTMNRQCSGEKKSPLKIDSIFSKSQKFIQSQVWWRRHTHSQACQNMCNKGKRWDYCVCWTNLKEFKRGVNRTPSTASHITWRGTGRK